VLESPLALSWADQAARTANGSLPLDLFDRRTTGWARIRHLPRRRVVRPLFGNGAKDFRDHVASAADDHLVTGTNVLAPDLIEIM